jgi:nucleoside-diphosphate-sugar epimerase
MRWDRTHRSASVPAPKNIYGVTKVAAEDLCELFHHRFALPCLVLRTSRFFPEEDDRKETRDRYADANAKANEFLYRRVDVEDIVSAHVRAIERAPSIGFHRFIISATTPFTREDLPELRVVGSPLARLIGAKGYHAETFVDGPYPVEP